MRTTLERSIFDSRFVSGSRLFLCCSFVAVVLLNDCFHAYGQTLGLALNATNLTWTTISAPPAAGKFWIAQSSTAHDGVSAARSPVLSSGQSSTLQTTVTGPGILTFWGKIDPTPFTGVTFKVNGVVQINMPEISSGSQNPYDWVLYTVYLGTGNHTLEWVSTLATYAYVDEVSFVTGAVPPLMINQPRSQSQVPGMDVSLFSKAGGTPPLNYQWRFNGSNISGAITNAMTVSNLQVSTLGSYTLVVTNAFGAVTSAIAQVDFGRVTAWGRNDFSQSRVSIGASNAIKVTAGWNHGVVALANGTAVNWGDDLSSSLIAPPGVTNLISVAGGGSHSIGLMQNGQVVAWGGNNFGQTNVPSLATNAVAIAAGHLHSLALLADGAVLAWGDNSLRQTNLPAALSNAVMISACPASSHSLALRSDGVVFAWGGRNFGGETNVPPSLTNAVAVAAGGGYSMALRADGSLVVWGNNGYGVSNIPASATNVVQVAGGGPHIAVLKANGTVISWGGNTSGQTNIPAGLTNVIALAAGNEFNVALVGEGPPISGAVVTNVNRGSDNFSFYIPSQCGRVFRLEYKNTLTQSEWTPLPLMAGNGTNLLLNDLSATNQARVYRVRRW
jgi:hypothetical protein